MKFHFTLLYMLHDCCTLLEFCRSSVHDLILSTHLVLSMSRELIGNKISFGIICDWPAPFCPIREEIEQIDDGGSYSLIGKDCAGHSIASPKLVPTVFNHIVCTIVA